MAVINFPTSPSTGQTYQTGSSATYTWNGSFWDVTRGKTVAIPTSYVAQTSSFATKAASYALTASYIESASTATSSSLAVTASYNVSASYGVSSSYSISSLFAETSSYAVSSSYTTSASVSNMSAAFVANDVTVPSPDNVFAVKYNNVASRFEMVNPSSTTFSFNRYGMRWQSSNTNGADINLPSGVPGTLTPGSFVGLEGGSAGGNYDAMTEEARVDIIFNNTTGSYHIKGIHDTPINANFITIEKIR